MSPSLNNEGKFVVTKNMLNPIAYIKEVNVELKRVTWPTKQEIVRLTTVVIVSSVLVGLFLSALDYVFTKLLGVIIG